jgi:hypothetical protein
MAKPFYSLEEVSQTLGKSQDDIKALVRSGALREFRDAGRVFFKAEDVEKVRRAAAGGGAPAAHPDVRLEPADEELPRLSDTAGGTSVIGLEPLPDEPVRAPVAPVAPMGRGGTTAGGTAIGVLEDELEIDADPKARTHVTAPGGGGAPVVESGGSGSGLLDLTREADDTSLGAELLDEIYPGEEEVQPAQRRAAGRPAAMADEPAETLAAAEGGEVLVPVMATVNDPTEGMFDGLMAGALVLLIVAGSVVAGTLQGFLPDYAQALSNRYLVFFAGAAGVLLIALLIGWLVGRSSSAIVIPRRK